MTTEYTSRLIGIGGRFHLEPDDPSGVPYAMDADVLK
jgi:hypothetical protein